MAELKIQVTAADVALYLTLSETLQQKSLDAAVLKPFVKAYNKRADANENLDTILSLTLAGAKADGPVAPGDGEQNAPVFGVAHGGL